MATLTLTWSTCTTILSPTGPRMTRGHFLRFGKNTKDSTLVLQTNWPHPQALSGAASQPGRTIRVEQPGQSVLFAEKPGASGGAADGRQTRRIFRRVRRVRRWNLLELALVRKVPRVDRFAHRAGPRQLEAVAVKTPEILDCSWMHWGGYLFVDF